MSSRHRAAVPSLAAVFLTLVVAASMVRAAPSDLPTSAAAVAWPPSTGVLVSEVLTGGASASDEFVELYNAGPATVDLMGDELVYVSATGGTITRKGTWATSRPLLPGQHLLLANSSGIHAAQADLTYSGGLAAGGGSIALRTADGSVIDAIGWGTATNGFVEGTVAPAPPAGSSLERLPGGADGNRTDTNDGSDDWFIQAAPDPQALADPPIPPSSGPTTTATDTPAGPTPSPTGTDTPGGPTPTASYPRAVPTETATSAAPTPTAEVTSTPMVTPTPAATPTALPSEGISSIVAARAAAPGTAVTVDGVLTVSLGFTDAGHGAFVQDAGAGIALYLTGNGWPALSAGTLVRVSGTTDVRYGQTTLRVASPARLTDVGPGEQPDPDVIGTGDAGEATEGRLVQTVGSVSSGTEALSDGFTVTIDDGTGPLRLVAPAASGLARSVFAHGAQVTAIGVLGQHSSGGQAADGYRVYLRSPSDVEIVASPTATPGAGPSGGPAASPSPAAIEPIASLSGLAQHAVVQGTVTSTGPIWGADDRRFTVQDGSGAILVRLPVTTRPPALGTRVQVAGTLAHYLGAPELVADGAPVTLGSKAATIPRPIGHAPVGAGLRWALAVAAGTVLQVRHGTSWRATIRLSDGSHLSVGAGAAARVPGGRVVLGSRVVITGIMRPPATGSSDPQLYLMARGPSDLTVLADAAGAAGGVTATVRPTPGGEPLDADLADLTGLVGRVVRVGGVVVAGDGTRLIVDDGTAQAVVRLPADAGASAPLPAGSAVTLVGVVVAGPAGSAEILLRTMADLAMAGDPGDGPVTDGAVAATATARVAGPALVDPAPATLATEGGIPAQLLAGVALAVACLVTVGLAAALWRRRTEALERRWQDHVQSRLASLHEAVPAGNPTAVGPSVGTRESRSE